MGGIFMLISDAINLRISELLQEYNMTAYRLSYRAGISNSIISDCKRGKVKEPTISSIIHLCEGLNIELKDFFNSECFKDVEAIDRFDKKQ
jgi:DNA-binding Xre family transcriptional regulator